MYGFRLGAITAHGLEFERIVEVVELVETPDERTETVD